MDECVPSPVFSPMSCPMNGGAPLELDLSAPDSQSADETVGLSLSGDELHAASVPGVAIPPESERLLEDVRGALHAGGKFVPAEDGDGVLLVLSPTGEPIAVWKSQFEERRDHSTAIEQGCGRGQRAQREFMAYLVDKALPPDLRAGVPPTVLAQINRRNGFPPHLGSIQRFVQSKSSSEDWGSSQFGRDNVQRIAIFDLLTLNLDRHGGNMLVGHDGKLIPIDHGYSLPEVIAGEPWLDWRLWPQASAPVDDGLRSSVLSINPLIAKPFAEALGLPDGVWQTVARMTVQLQHALTAGQTLRDVAESLMPETAGAYEDALEDLSLEDMSSSPRGPIAACLRAGA